ncbi:hypothetical protein [Citricoccus alkalitolerans]|uniref:Uncharacterized protein n=1 Tax=Citricoccus alkalitolerans TaxID=246603 RepID=A0ABV8Y1I3_9MICC
MDVSDWIAVAATVIALVSGGLALRANHHAAEANDKADKANGIAERANGIADEALKDARDAREAAIWDSALEALHGLVNFNYAMPSKDVGPYMSSVRFRLMALADHIDRPAVAGWLEEAWKTASVLMREAGEARIDPGEKDIPGALLRANAPVADWVVQALIGNLRFMRANGITDEKAAELEANAVDITQGVRDRNDWQDDGSASPFRT